MNKFELVATIATSADITKADAERALNGIMEAITDALSKGDKVALIGFGTFSTTKRAARDGRNPQTGKTMKIKAKTIAKFKAGAKLADAVN
jgi:DNA-binding protein HU-beta